MRSPTRATRSWGSSSASSTRPTMTLATTLESLCTQTTLYAWCISIHWPRRHFPHSHVFSNSRVEWRLVRVALCRRPKDRSHLLHLRTASPPRQEAGPLRDLPRGHGARLEGGRRPQVRVQSLAFCRAFVLLFLVIMQSMYRVVRVVVERFCLTPIISSACYCNCPAAQ